MLGRTAFRERVNTQRPWQPLTEAALFAWMRQKRGDYLGITGDYGKVTKSFIERGRCRLLQDLPAALLEFKTARDSISLIANRQQLIAQTGEAQHVNRLRVRFQIIATAGHRFAGLGKFVRGRDAVKAAIERFIFAIDEPGQESRSLILIAQRKIPDRHSLGERFFANPQVTVPSITINELRVLVNVVGFAGFLPGGRG